VGAFGNRSPTQNCCHIWAASWFMAKRKTGFVMDWLDDTQYWDPNSDLELRLSLIREDTHIFARHTTPLDTDGYFLRILFCFRLEKDSAS
jgi:hypothetical protein